jgi:uncharacterized caspase-like protein
MIANKRMLAAFALFSTTALTPLAVSAQQAAQNPRIALVIGNATYKDQALATTANDAGLVAQTLQAAGFEVIGARDLDEKSVQTAFRGFLDKAAAAGPDMQAFVYLGGRGLQYNGDNYFVPVDAQINRDADVPIEALRISDFAHALAQRPGKARIIVLDAARANPYAAQGAPLAPGLALVDPEPGELMAFNAAPGTLAGEEQGPYGVYGKTLAGAMRQGGVDVATVFDQTRVTVNQQTQGALIPWSASKLTEPYYIFERAADAPPPAVVAAAPASQPIAGLPADAAYAAALQRDTMQGYEDYLAAYPDSDQARRVRAILAARREASFWRRSINANTSHAYWTYLRIYPKGPHVADARRRLAIISAAYEPPPDFQPTIYQDLPPPPPDESFYEEQPYYAFDEFGPPPPPPPPIYYYAEDDDWRDLPPPPPPEDIGILPVLIVGIPLIVGAIAYHDHFHRDGIAPVGTRPPPPPPPAPPPLPPHVKPVTPPPPVPIVGGAAGGGIVKPLPPIAAPPPAGGKPSGTLPPVAGKPPTVAPGVVASPPGVSVTTPGGKPTGIVTLPTSGKPAGAPIAPAQGKALPVPPTVAPGTVTPPPGTTPGGKPTGIVTLPASGKPAGTLIAPAPGKALPVPPPAATAPTAPNMGLKQLPKAPGQVLTPAPGQILQPKPGVNSPATAPAAPPKMPGAPVVHAPPQAPVVRAPAPQAPAYRPPPPAAPVYRAPPTAAPAYRAPPPAAPVYRAPPPAAPVYRAPPPAAPVYRAPPPAAPVYRAPSPAAPVYRAPPPAAPVYRAPPPAAPVYRAPPPAAARAPMCGRPGLPPCPK